MKTEYDNSEHKSTGSSPHFDNIPSQMKELRQWVRWRLEDRKGKPTKVPLNPRTGQMASSTDPSTWGTYEEAIESRFGNGIGFVFTEASGIVGIDLDHVIHDGELEPWAQEIIIEINSYTELSPSGEGLHTYFFASLPAKGRKKGQFECYSQGRFFTVTGNHFLGTPLTLEERFEALRTIHSRIFGKQEEASNAKRPSTPHNEFSDEEIIEKAAKAANGEKFTKLWRGEWQGDYPSQSEADAALCSILAFYLKRDTARIDACFRRSGLMRPKWEERHFGNGNTYGQETIARILAHNPKIRKFEDSGGTLPIPSLNACDGDLSRVTQEAWEALHALNHPPQFFRQGNLLVRIEKDPYGRPIFRELTLDRVLYHLALAGHWYKITEKGHKLVWPPKGIAKNILATPDPLLPVIKRVIEAPFFAPNFSLQLKAGYCPDALVYYSPPEGFQVPNVPMKPRIADIEKAKQLLLNELLGDFPFADVSDKAHAFALMIQPFVRDLIAGPTPLHLIEKPAPGTGATLLAETLFCPAIGHAIAAMSEGRDEDEWRKRITAKLIAGPSAVLIDNLRRPLDSSALSIAITTGLWEDRFLGRSEIIQIPVHCAWVATGNNPRLSNEIARRTIRIRLDAMVDQPWRRNGFRHPKLREWALQNRADLVWALLVIAQSWIASGRPMPKQNITLGQFESWSEVIGGILENAGIRGFLSNLSAFYEASDIEGETLRRFVSLWWETHSGKEIGISDLWKIVDANGIEINLGQGNERSQKTRLGILLVKLRDRQFGSFRITEGPSKNGARTWRLVHIDFK